MLVEDHFFYLHADPELFEPLERYRARVEDFLGPVRRLLPDGWRVDRKGIWFNCSPPQAELQPQGWKIHLSATPANAPAVLTTAARLLVREGVPFKFAADRMVLFLVNGKRWSRGGAGKFVTIYPADTARCGELLESLRQALSGYGGPYILSDRRYRDSGVVHYRYGGILPTRRLDVTGRSVPVMQLGDGRFVDDERLPFFHLPTGMADPFAAEEAADAQADGTLKQGRYEIESVISFSNPGGVYVARDRETGRKVLIKEARPFTNVSPQGTDAVWLLKKEHRLLTILEDTGVAPRPLDFFKDWEHSYLVEEFVEGIILRGYMAQHSLGLRTRASAADARDFFGRYRRVFLRIIAALNTLHGRGIVFSDLSHYNVMVLGDGEEIRLIDFEGAYEQGVDVAVSLYTPGFAPVQALMEGAAQPADDYFALGGLMLAGLIPVNSLLLLNPRAHEPFLAAMTRDLGLPEEIAGVIRTLMVQERSRRPDLGEAVRVLAAEPAAPAPEAPSPSPAAEREEAEAALRRLRDHILAAADVSRQDRLFPADPAVFETNPLGVAHGACGVACALQRIDGGVPAEVRDWILRQDLTVEAYPPGLYVGLAGIAWSLLEMGLRDRAEQALALAGEHHLLWRSPDLFYGAAGWGMAQLRFFLATGDESYLSRAEAAGRFLVGCRTEEDGRCWWTAQGDVCCGLAHGASGVSLFLLYLYLATRNEELLDIGHRGLQFVAARALRNADGGLTWRAKESAPTYTPYWRWGSAGIGMVLLRYRRVLGDPVYGTSLIEDLLIDTDRKYTIFPGRSFGLAGIGELYLDLAAMDGDRERALAGAWKALSGILLFRLEKGDGLAFPGETLARISCDFGTGSAGIALFLHRLLRGGPPPFMLDELLGMSGSATAPRAGLALAV